MSTIVFPAEWYPQSLIQLTWPHDKTDWFDILDEVVPLYITLSKEIVKHSRLLIACHNKAERNEVKKHFSPTELQQIIFVEVESNDTWSRDHGAISVFIDGKPTIYDFGYNAWGLKFAANHDNQITKKIYEKNIFSKEVEYSNRLDFILEGGAIESDGEGTLLTTSKCLLAANRNQPRSKEEIEQYLKEQFGLVQVLWLDYGYLSGDDTDSHIDTLARFCNKSTIAYVQCDNPEDEHYVELLEMEKQLKTFKTIDGAPYSLIALPMADPVFYKGYRLPATYANFLIMNSVVIYPKYNTDKDEIAKLQLQKAFPNHEMVGIDCTPLIKQHGSLHCITKHSPAVFF